jgi:hypothetical protein
VLRRMTNKRDRVTDDEIREFATEVGAAAAVV